MAILCAKHPKRILVRRQNQETGEIIDNVCMDCGKVPDEIMDEATPNSEMARGSAPTAFGAKSEAESAEGPKTAVAKVAPTSEDLLHRGSTKSFQSREVKEVLSLITRGVIAADGDITRDQALALVQDVIQLKRQGVANGGMNIIKAKLYVNKNGLMSLAGRYDKDFFAIDFVVPDEATKTAHAVPEGWLAFVARYKINAGMGKVRRKLTHPDGTIEEIEEEKRMIEIKSEALGMANPRLQKGGAEKDYPAAMAKIRATRAVIQNVISTLPIGEEDQSLFLDLITSGVEFSEEVDAKLAEAAEKKQLTESKGNKEPQSTDDNPGDQSEQLSEPSEATA